MYDEQSLKLLTQNIEQRIGFPMRTPKDFDTLSESILRKVHSQVSSSTLKRIWGYLPSVSTPRQSTLDILAQYLDFADFQSFCLAQCGAAVIEETDDEPVEPSPQPVTKTIGGEDTSGNSLSFFHKQQWPWLVLLVVLTAGAAYIFGLFIHKSDKEGQSLYILRKGQTFATYQDYLVLFGIHAEDYLWGQRLPHHPSISVWGPLYHHPEWHNEGDSARLLPTITERWEPTDGSADSTFIATRNSDRYLTYLHMNELRITFMRGLTPDGDSLTFLGVYRMDMKHSNLHHITWVRVAEEVDLNHLDYLEELRN